MIYSTSTFSFLFHILKQTRTLNSYSIPILKFTKRLLLIFFILPLLFVSPTLLAEPHQAQNTAPVTNSLPAESSTNSSTDNKVKMHHPRGDLEGSYGFNTPAQPGFWIAAGFTGVIFILLISSFVFFKSGKPG